MALKSDLEAREAECGNAADFAALAKDALNEPQDADYAKHLVQQGEMQCQFPIDYLQIAEVALALGETDQADELFQQAEDFCMEGNEFAQVASSLAAHTDQKDRAAELLEKAVSQANQPEEFINYAKVASEAFGNKALAAKLMDKVKEKCPDIEAFKALAKKILTEKDDPKTAKTVYQHASSLGDGPEDVPAYAAGLIELFDDQDGAAETLAAAEGDCMFPKQFVAMASGYKQLLDNTEKASELLEQGKEFAMSGEENLDLANGYADLLEDKETAQALYQQALGDFANKDDLLKLSEDMASRIDDKALIKSAYSKAEEKITDANDLALLAKSINTHLGDAEMAASVYSKAQGRLSNPIELVRLAGEIHQTLNNAALVGDVYKKALEVAGDYPALEKILQSLDGDYKDEALAQAVLDKVLITSEEASEMMSAAKWSGKLLSGKQTTLKLLDMSEELVKALEDFRKLVRVAGELAADDEKRLERLKTKLEKREASQARYVEFQDKEKILSRPAEFMDLARAVVEELDDPSYASKLLQNGQEILDLNAFDLPLYLRQLMAVDQLVQDSDWIERLLIKCSDNSQYYAQVRLLGQCAGQQLSDQQTGKAFAKSLYQNWQDKLTQESTISAYELGKLSNAIRTDIDDQAWAMTCFESARNSATDHFQLLYLASLANQWGETDLAADLYREAGGRCTTAEAFVQLVVKLKADRVDETIQRKLYEMGKDSLTEPRVRLRWAEGIIQLFGDTAWAKEVYQSLEGDFKEDASESIYQRSFQVNLASLRH